MVVSDDNDRDGWVRLTLRLPPNLHAAILKRAGAYSLNSAILQFLQEALLIQDQKEQIRMLLVENEELRAEQELMAKMTALSQTIRDTRSKGSQARSDADRFLELADALKTVVRDEIRLAMGKCKK